MLLFDVSFCCLQPPVDGVEAAGLEFVLQELNVHDLPTLPPEVEQLALLVLLHCNLNRSFPLIGLHLQTICLRLELCSTNVTHSQPFSPALEKRKGSILFSHDQVPALGMSPQHLHPVLGLENIVLYHSPSLALSMHHLQALASMPHGEAALLLFQVNACSSLRMDAQQLAFLEAGATFGVQIAPCLHLGLHEHQPFRPGRQQQSSDALLGHD
mmetsp:Transcript_151730/g.265146  ORF Transcript_151730/g.265146 Transcript_151730/m.265146 type:complete len:213 (-) Transcript_151730:1432-2070(-)